MPSLRAAYKRVGQVLGEAKEDWESVDLVARYRQYWRPERVNVVLLAESHVYTSGDDRSIRAVARADLAGGYPRRYARFVYCLSYGERDLTSSEHHPRRDGTPQFWKIFHACANRVESNADFAPILKGATPEAEERIRNKIHLLSRLKAAGIWLVDASVVALYGQALAEGPKRAAIWESWHACTRSVVETAKPHSVICIGSRVWDMVGKDLQQRYGGNAHHVQQPNARLTAAEHLANYQRYSAICAPFMRGKAEPFS